MTRRCPACRTDYPDNIAFCGHDGKVTIQVQPPGEDADPHLGQRLGQYIIVAHVADGAMGAVYEARQAETRERVAIKVLHADVATDEIAVERFNREYETADMLDHPNVVRVLDFGETANGSSRFLTMEFLEGQELGELLRTSDSVSPARTLKILTQVALALEYSHSFGVVHRDLKPDNVFLCEGEHGDEVRILDFGSVKLQVEMGPKLTAFGTTLGSPYYMSPEQAKGLPDVDGRTDVFAIGAILYEMLSGNIAFEGSTVAEILMKIVRSMPPRLDEICPHFPPAITDVVERAIAKDKTERFSTPVEFVDAALNVFGLAGSAADWGTRPLSDFEEAVARGPSLPPPKMTQPLASQAVGDDTGPTLDQSMPQGTEKVGIEDAFERAPVLVPARESSPAIWLLALAALVLLALSGAVTAFLLFL